MAVKAPRLGGRGSVTLDAAAFESRFNMALVHETVRAELNARRRGTASTLTRGQTRGGGAKPWRQKGTGRARAGSSRSPLWAGGGIVFGPSPRSYTVKVNRKARRGALRSALSEHAGRGSIAVFDASKFTEPSTAQAADLIDAWEAANKSALVLLDESEEFAGLSFRNIARVNVMPVGDAGVADVIGAAALLVSEAALPRLVALAAGSQDASASEAGTAADTDGEATAPNATASDADASSGGDADEPMPRDDAPEIEEPETPEDDA